MQFCSFLALLNAAVSQYQYGAVTTTAPTMMIDEGMMPDGIQFHDNSSMIENDMSLREFMRELMSPVDMKPNHMADLMLPGKMRYGGRHMEGHHMKRMGNDNEMMDKLTEFQKKARGALVSALANSLSLEEEAVQKLVNVALLLRNELPPMEAMMPGVNHFMTDNVVLKILSMMPEDGINQLKSVVDAIKVDAAAMPKPTEFLAVDVPPTSDFMFKDYAAEITSMLTEEWGENYKLFAMNNYPMINEVISVVSSADVLIEELNSLYSMVYPPKLAYRLMHGVMREMMMESGVMPLGHKKMKERTHGMPSKPTDMTKPPMPLDGMQAEPVMPLDGMRPARLMGRMDRAMPEIPEDFTIENVIEHVLYESKATVELIELFNGEYGELWNAEDQFAFWNGAKLLANEVVKPLHAALKILSRIGDLEKLEALRGNTSEQFLPAEIFESDTLSSDALEIVQSAREIVTKMIRIVEFADDFRAGLELTSNEFDFIEFLDTLKMHNADVRPARHMMQPGPTEPAMPSSTVVPDTAKNNIHATKALLIK